jgi:hypothetical protein
MTNKEDFLSDVSQDYSKPVIMCSTYKCNKAANFELLVVLEKHTMNRKVMVMYACKDCVGYESDAIVSVSRIR